MDALSPGAPFRRRAASGNLAVMERLNYTPDEIREAFRYARERCGHLAASHAGNWRRKFTQFEEAFTKNQEALKLLARLFDGHRTASGSKWYRAAADRAAPPLPTDRYERLALVWKLITMAVQKANPDGFDAREKIDLPYVLVNSDLPGGSLGEKFEELRVRMIVPFCEELERFAAAIERSLPEGAASVDLWDAALAAFAAKDVPEKAERASAALEAGPGPAPAAKPRPAGRKSKPAPKKKAAKKKP